MLFGCNGLIHELGHINYAISSEPSSRASDKPLFSKMCITFDPTVGSTSNLWNWKANLIIYFMTKFGLNSSVGILPSIGKPLTYMHSYAHRMAPESPKFSKTYLDLKRL